MDNTIVILYRDISQLTGLMVQEYNSATYMGNYVQKEVMLINYCPGDYTTQHVKGGIRLVFNTAQDLVNWLLKYE